PPHPPAARVPPSPPLGAERAGVSWGPLITLNVRIDMRLGLGARMGHGALLGVADRLRVFPQRARLVVVAARLPRLAARRQLGVAELDGDGPGLGVDRDDVAVAQQADRAADRRLGPDMADAESARRAGEAAVGDERHLVA